MRSLKKPPPEEQPFPVRGYVIINVLFYAFLGLVFLATWLIQRGEIAGLIPFLFGLAVIFTLVTVYDGAFDRHVYKRHLAEKKEARQAQEEEKPELPPEGPATAKRKPAKDK
jgi:hypothetical protein